MLAAPLALCVTLVPGAFAGSPTCEPSLAGSSVAAQPLQNQHANQMVIIIDDLGHSLKRGQNAIDLPGNLTYAVIPHTTYGRTLAEHAHLQGKEIMLHAPMSTVDGDPLGAGGLTANLSRSEFNSRLNDALAEVPYAQGINNHMGSDLTQRRVQMAWLMQELRWQELYFVDSRTSGKTVAAKVATEFNVPNLSRQIFLDNDVDPAAIAERFAQAVARAKKRGRAVVIGHPYPETIRYLREALPTLSAEGIALVTVSQALELSDTKSEERVAAAGTSALPGEGCS